MVICVLIQEQQGLYSIRKYKGGKDLSKKLEYHSKSKGTKDFALNSHII
jgi:hypothetical protein